jgi:hypothetical protein
MVAKRQEATPATRLVGRAELIGLAFFICVGLLALPFVRDAFVIQQLWLSICSAVGISG